MGPRVNSASFITQWQDVIIARVGLSINEDLGVSCGAVIHQKAIEAYDRLVPYAVMCKEYPEFGREVREAEWKGPIKNEVQDRGKCIWRRWRETDGVLGTARNVWGKVWARHNMNGVPSGIQLEEHFKEFRKKCYIELMKGKGTEGKEYRAYLLYHGVTIYIF
jgi:hypothetical protein